MKKFCMFQASVVEDTHKDLLNADMLSEFKRRDIQYCHLKNYDLTYALYSKFPSWVWREPRPLGSGCISHIASENLLPFLFPSPFLSFLFFLFFLLSSLASPSSFNVALLRAPSSFRRAAYSRVNGRFPLSSYAVKSLVGTHHEKEDYLYRLVLPSDLVLFCWWRTKIS